jgi:signal recognition particle subunit SRP54
MGPMSKKARGRQMQAQSKKGKKGKKGKGSPARRPMGAPGLPPGGMPAGNPFGGMPGLPPGQALPDLSKLKFDQPGDGSGR